MMRLFNSLLAATALLSIYACQHPKHSAGSNDWACDRDDSDWNQPFIRVEAADSMINSYLTSINYQLEDSNVRSFIIDADALRQYLLCGKGRDISKLKIMLAHNQDYIRNGGFGQPCGYSNTALTIVLAGYDAAGDYIYAPKGRVMDFSMPCPKDCPKAGSATSDLLPSQP